MAGLYLNTNLALLPELNASHTYDAYKIVLSCLKHKANKDFIIELD
jgi:hypothetical protein